jgi:hypothetical protein
MSLYRLSYTDKKTGEKKESAVWWYEFTFAGRLIRESAKTTRKTIAAEAEKRRRLELQKAGAGMTSEDVKDRTRSVADLIKQYTLALRTRSPRPSAVDSVLGGGGSRTGSGTARRQNPSRSDGNRDPRIHPDTNLKPTLSADSRKPAKQHDVESAAGSPN